MVGLDHHASVAGPKTTADVGHGPPRRRLATPRRRRRSGGPSPAPPHPRGPADRPHDGIVGRDRRRRVARRSDGEVARAAAPARAAIRARPAARCRRRGGSGGAAPRRRPPTRRCPVRRRRRASRSIAARMAARSASSARRAASRRGERLDGRAHLVDVGEQPTVEPGTAAPRQHVRVGEAPARPRSHRRADVRAGLDEPLRRQHVERLAHDAARRAEAGGDTLAVDDRPRREAAVDDVAPDAGGDALDQPASTRGVLTGAPTGASPRRTVHQ